MKNHYDLALVFPCYNQEQRIEKTWEAYNQYLDRDLGRQKRIAMIFIDDGSTDRTGALLHRFHHSSGSVVTVEVIQFKKNQGKGAAIKAGLEAVDADYYGFIDADLSYGPELLPSMLAGLRDHDLVIAQKINHARHDQYERFRNRVSRILQVVANRCVGLPPMDTQRGFKFFTRRVAQEIFLKTAENRFAFDLEALARAHHAGFSIKSVPVEFQYRSDSTLRWADGYRYLFDMVAIADRLRTTADARFWWWCGLVYGMVTAIIFGWTVRMGYFFSDDFTWLWHGAKINLDLRAVMATHMSTFYSPVLNLFYTVMYHWFGYYAPVYFLADLIVHAANAMMAAVIAWQLTRSRLISFLTGFMVTVAGGAFEPLVWVGANMHSIATFFILSGIACYAAYFRTGKIKYLAVSFVTAVLALGSKEIAVVFPALLIAVVAIFLFRDRGKILGRGHVFYWVVLTALVGAYGWQQYLWQKQSVWVRSGIWSFSWHTLGKIPLVLADIFVPLSTVVLHLSREWVGILLVVSTLFLGGMMYVYRRLPLVRLGFAWLLITILPTLPFGTIPWWAPLASRYTYLPRLGMIFILVAIVHHHISKNTARYVVPAFVAVIGVIAALQFSMMAHIVRNDYAYVYQSGRSLYAVMEQIKDMRIAWLYIPWNHPFPDNPAHIVGAASTIAGLPEEQLIFLPKGSSTIPSGEAWLYWNPHRRQYEIKVSP